jgi:hypothetical protein
LLPNAQINLTFRTLVYGAPPDLGVWSGGSTW